MSPTGNPDKPRQIPTRDPSDSSADTNKPLKNPIPPVQPATTTTLTNEPPQAVYPSHQRSLNHRASYQDLISPNSRRFIDSANAPPPPTSRSVSPQIATKYTKATEYAKLRPQSPLRKGLISSEDDQENTPISKIEEEHSTLHRPKSKLRLRLKLTPPHLTTIKQSETPPKPSLKIKLLSSTSRANEPMTRKPTHQHQTSVSTIRAHTPTKQQPSDSTKEKVDQHRETSASPAIKTAANFFSTRFESSTADLDSEDERHRQAADEQLEREKRTIGWFPPAKAIPRSRSAWNLRTAEGKAAKSREDEGETREQGSFESDFDGRNFGKGPVVDLSDAVSRKSSPKFFLRFKLVDSQPPQETEQKGQTNRKHYRR